MTSLLSKPFEYKSLHGLPDDTIRLFTIQPRSLDEDIHISIITVKLQDNPQFRALSYVWGDDQNKRIVWLDKRPLQVRENLWKCLRRLRDDHESYKLWADAICVNQQDIQERTVQVQLMTRIYSEAQLVIVWLGGVISGGELKSTEKVFPDHLSPAKLRTGDYGSDAATFQRILEAARHLVNRPYWSRMWVLQEFVLPQDLLLIYDANGRLRGNHLADWMEISGQYQTHLTKRARARVLTLNKQDQAILRASMRMSSLHPPDQLIRERDLFHNTSTTEGRNLESMLERYGEAQCSDPRDLVYALLGVSCDNPLKADYTKPYGVVFYDVILFTNGTKPRVYDRLARRSRVQELKTLILCLVGLHQLDTLGGLDLLAWMHSALSNTEGPYDQAIINWFQVPSQEWKQLVEEVAYEEEAAKQAAEATREGFSSDARHLRVIASEKYKAFVRYANAKN